MTPLEIQKKLNQIRTKKSQIDSDITQMSASVDEAVKPLEGIRVAIGERWEDWKRYNSFLMREGLIGENKDEKRVRFIARIVLGKELADAYTDAWEAAPKAIKNIDELLQDLIRANKMLQEAKKQILSVQIPSSVSNKAQLFSITSRVKEANTGSNQAIDAARSILKALPGRRKKIKPLILAAMKIFRLALAKLNRREDRLEDRSIVIKKEARLKCIRKGQEIIKPFLIAAKKFFSQASKFVNNSGAKEKSIKSKQAQMNNAFASIQSSSGSSNRTEAGPESVAVHILAIGAVAAGICAFDHFERSR